MKVTAAVIAQAESSRVSPDPGSTSHQDSDGSFAQTFYRSIRKSQADSASSASSPEATRGTPSGETSVAMPSAENAVAALPSESPNGLPDQVKLRGNVRPEARAGGTLYTFDRRATTGRDATPQVLEARQTVGRSGSGTPQGGAPARSALLAGAAPATAERKLTARAADDARAEAQAAAGARPDAEPTAADLPDLAAVDSPPTPPSAGQGPLPRLAEGHWSRIVPESRSTTAGGDTAGAGDSASGPPVAAEQPSLRRAATQTAALVSVPATPFPGGGTDSPQLSPTRASQAPVALFGGFGTDTPLSPPASRAPVAATPSTPTAGGARIARVFAIPTALSAPTSDGKLLAGNPAMPLDAFVSGPTTPFPGGGTDSPQLPRASRTPVAPFGGFGTDTPPLPPPRASRAHVAATPSTPTAGEPRTAHVFAARTAVPTPKSDGTRLAPTFATPLDAPVPEPATPFPGASTDSPELPPTRASQAPVAPFGGFGTDTPPLPPPRASRAHVATMPSTPTAGEPGAAQVFVARKAIPTAVAHGTHATHAPDEPSPAGAAPAQHRPASNPSDASAPIVSPPTAGPVADIASLAAQLTQPASLPPSSPSSVTPSAHSAGTASTEVPLAAAGTRSRPAKPTPAGTPVSTPTSAPPAPSKAEPSVLVAPANQSLVEPHAGAREASTEEPARAQDATDGPGPQPPASLAAFIAASNFPTPPSQTDDMGRLRPAEMASGPEHGQAPRSGKDTGDPAVPGAPLPTPAAHNQPGLRAEAQATAPLTQTQLQGTLPVHSPATNGPTSASLADPRGATHLPAHAASLAAQVARDDGLSMTVLPHAAHMAIESPDGDLALHMRVRQGSAEISVGGSMAHLFATRAPEARAALASEGLALGRFDSGQQEGGQQGQPAPETPEPAGEAPAPYRPTHGGPLPAPAEGRIHVTA